MFFVNCKTDEVKDGTLTATSADCTNVAIYSFYDDGAQMKYLVRLTGANDYNVLALVFTDL